MSFNHACPDVPAPVIADSAVLLGPAWVGAGVVLAQGTVVRSHEATVSIDNHSAVLENSSVLGTSDHPVTIGQRTVFGHRCQVIGARVVVGRPGHVIRTATDADRERVARLRDYAVELTTHPCVWMTVEAPAAGATMGRLYAYQDKLPQIAASALLLDSAEVTGDVVIGPGAMIHGCRIEAGTVVEPAAIICDYSRVRAGSLVRAGACVKQRASFPAHSVLDGFPAEVVHTLPGPPRGRRGR